MTSRGRPSAAVLSAASRELLIGG
ncbi:hypothetical protein ACIRFF_16300 [Streptomyces cyaneofuscatus]